MADHASICSSLEQSGNLANFSRNDDSQLNDEYEGLVVQNPIEKSQEDAESRKRRVEKLEKQKEWQDLKQTYDSSLKSRRNEKSLLKQSKQTTLMFAKSKPETEQKPTDLSEEALNLNSEEVKSLSLIERARLFVHMKHGSGKLQGPSSQDKKGKGRQMNIKEMFNQVKFKTVRNLVISESVLPPKGILIKMCQD